MKISFNDLKGDLFGGITSAVVGLPVALAFGVASGLGALAGIYGAIAVGFFAAVFGGTRSQISGPTGPMAVAMAVFITSHATNLSEAFTIVVLAGLIQILLGALRIGRFVAFTPYSVISGFMSGIGIIIMVLQTLPFLGWPVASGGPLATIGMWPEVAGNINLHAAAIASVTLLIGIFWPRQISRFLPSTLAALIIGTLIGVFWLRGTPVIGEVPSGLPVLNLPLFSPDLLARAMQPALTMALLGSIDSLLTSLIADSMTRTRHKPNQELVGQGIGNLAAGLFGGVPGAGATVGTVVNIRAGGRTQLSGAIRALLLLALVLGQGQQVEMIPHAVLAGILIKVGWDIVDWRFLKHIFSVHREHLLVMLITLGLTVFVDLLTAVAIGLIAAGMANARQFERLELDSVVSVPILDQEFLVEHDKQKTGTDPYSARVGLVALKGSFTVASAIKLTNAISLDIRDHEVVIFDFSETVYLDESAAMVIEQLIDGALDEGTPCIVLALTGHPAQTLNGLDVLRRVPDSHCTANLEDAKAMSRQILDIQAT